MRTSGLSDSSFSIDLRESVQLSDSTMRVDNIRLTNSFLTTDLGKYIYYKDGSGGIQYYSVPEMAYNGTELAAALQSATGKTTTYDHNSNSITQSITAGQEWLSDDALKQFSTGFPAGVSASAPLSLNIILGNATAGANLVFIFVKMAPYDYLYSRSRKLTAENIHGNIGRHDVLVMIPLTKGIGLVETASSPDGVYIKLPSDLVLRSNIDFQLTDYKGDIVNLRGRPISFQISFD